MANYKIGDFIRLTRKSVGISQEELAFQAGVATETISRIENGRHKITQSIYQKIMSSLNQFQEQSYGICTSEEVGVIDEKQLAEDAEVKFEFEKAREYLKTVEGNVSKNVINEQYIKRAYGVIDYYTGLINIEDMISLLEESLRLTVDDYEKYLDCMDYKNEGYPYTAQEILILLNLADAYGKVGNYKKDEKIKRMLLKCLDSGYIGGESISNMKLVIKRNLSLTLARMRKYEEALELLDSILISSIKEGNGLLIPVVLYDMTWNMRKINDKGNQQYDSIKIKRIMRQAYYIAAARCDYNVQEIIKKSFNSEFNEDVEIRIE